MNKSHYELSTREVYHGNARVLQHVEISPSTALQSWSKEHIPHACLNSYLGGCTEKMPQLFHREKIPQTRTNFLEQVYEEAYQHYMLMKDWTTSPPDKEPGKVIYSYFFPKKKKKKVLEILARSMSERKRSNSNEIPGWKRKITTTTANKRHDFYLVIVHLFENSMHAYNVF